MKPELNCGSQLLENGSFVENDCSNPNFQLNGKLKLFLWNNEGQISQKIDIKIAGNITFNDSRKDEVVIIGHDMGENGEIEPIKKLVTRVYEKRPNSILYSIDWSELVR